jgi:hypothetical protein
MPTARSVGPDQPRLKVKLVDKVGRKGKVKVCFDDGPHPGLVEYVASRQLVVPWEERSAVLRDEKRAGALDDHAREVFDPALGEASSAVLESSGEPGAGAAAGGTTVSESELQRIVDRAGVTTAPVDLHPLAYRDRRGDVHLPLEATVDLARAFAAAEPETVVSYLEEQEEEMRLRGNQPGERWWHDYLREKCPAMRSLGNGLGLSRNRRCYDGRFAPLLAGVGRRVLAHA